MDSWTLTFDVDVGPPQARVDWKLNVLFSSCTASSAATFPRQILSPDPSPFREMSSSLGLIYDAHAAALFGFLLNFTRNECETRDILQELFFKLASRPAPLEGVRDPRSYLIRLAHHLAIDFHRSRASRNAAIERAAAEPGPLFLPAADPDEGAFREALAAALGDLPAEQRAVVHLKLWEGLTFAEIAGALDIPANTAASRYRYAVDKLQELLRPLYEEL